MEKRDFRYALLILLVIIMVLLVLNLKQAEANRWEPDAVYPMCNQHIEWTYAKGRFAD